MIKVIILMGFVVWNGIRATYQSKYGVKRGIGSIYFSLSLTLGKRIFLYLSLGFFVRGVILFNFYSFIGLSCFIVGFPSFSSRMYVGILFSFLFCRSWGKNIEERLVLDMLVFLCIFLLHAGCMRFIVMLQS